MTAALAAALLERNKKLGDSDEEEDEDEGEGAGFEGATHVPAAFASSSAAHARARSPRTRAIACVRATSIGLFAAALICVLHARARCQNVRSTADSAPVSTSSEFAEGSGAEEGEDGRNAGRMMLRYPIAVNQYDLSAVADPSR